MGNTYVYLLLLAMRRQNCYKCVIGFSGVDKHDIITGNITKNLEVFTLILLILGDLIIKHLNNNKNY